VLKGGRVATKLVEVDDFLTAQSWFRDRNLTDGLPIIPPTPDLVDAMVNGGVSRAEDIIGFVQGRPEDPVTVEQAAVCAVMAGAEAEYFPVILASWAAILDPALNAASTIGSSGGTAMTTIVSGPYASVIGMNATRNVFGPGNHANATIGRAVRLGVMNALNYRSGEMDGAAFGNQARYTAHFAEKPPLEPWQPLNVRMGYAASTTTVTVTLTDAPRQVNNWFNNDPECVLATLGAAMRDPSHMGAGQGNPFVVVIGPEHEQILVQAGWSQEAVRERLVQLSRTTAAELSAAGRPVGETGWPILLDTSHAEFDSDGMLPMARWEDLILVTAGGNGSGWSHVIFGYAYSEVARPVTKEVVLP
jgi:hypothetical protein